MFNIGTKEIINELENFKFEKIDSYEVIELIDEPSQEVIDLAEKIKEKTEKDLKNCSEQQLKFYSDCSKLIFGDIKDSSPILIPAKCGFGKTTFLKSVISTLIDEIKNDKPIEKFLPMIIVQERLEDLKELCKHINKLGKYNNKIPYIHLLEGWNEKFECKNDFPPKNIEESYARCNSNNCNVFNKCKLNTQYLNAKKSPILAITTSRLSYITNNNELNKYMKFQNKNDIEILRNRLIIDEKPKLIRNDFINSKLVRKLKEIVEEYNSNKIRGKNFSTEIEAYLLKELNSIEDYINDSRVKFEEYKNLVITFDKDIIKEEFVKKWNENIKKKIPDFDLLLEAFNKPLLWSVNGKKYSYYLIDHNNFNTDGINTYIFDGTAEITLEYKSDFNKFKYLKIDQYKDYSHLNFHIIKENLSRSSLRDDPDKLETVCKWINKNFKEETYVISYKEYSDKINSFINNNKVIKILDRDKKKVIPYFGNTKGKNEWSNCKKMVQFGWNRFSNGDYISQFLALNPMFINLLQKAYEILDRTENPLDTVIRLITLDNRGNFHNKELQKYMLMKTVIDLEQEVYRTHVREFTSFEKVDVYLFIKNQYYKDIKELISFRFKNCKFIEADNSFREFEIFEKHPNVEKLFKELDAEWKTERKEIAILTKKYLNGNRRIWNRYFSEKSDLKNTYKFLLDIRKLKCIKEKNKLYLVRE